MTVRPVLAETTAYQTTISMTQNSSTIQLPPSPVRPTAPLGVATIVLGLGICAMLVLWSLDAIAHAHPNRLPNLTDRGKLYFYPEYDLHVYVVGTIISTFLAVVIGMLWRRRMQADPARMKQVDRRLLLLQLLLLFCLIVLQVVRLPLWIGVAICLPATIWAWTVGFKKERKESLDGRRKSWSTLQARKYGWKLRTILDLLAVASLAFYCFVPSMDDLILSVEVRDACHHWDQYLMAPALAFRHGKSLGLEANTQYGVGWPLLLATMSSGAKNLEYIPGLRIAAGSMFLYFIGLYFFLRVWLRSCPWALAGTWLAFGLHVFFGGGPILLNYPSSTILRYSMDIACFAALLGYNRSRRNLFAILAGIAAGLAVLFGTDTGIYLTAAVGCYAVGCAVARPSRRLVMAVAWGACSWLTMVLVGLSAASRMSILSIQFWKGWSEPLWVYGGGLGSLPIAGMGWSNRSVLVLVMVIFVYLFVICRMFLRLAQRTETLDGILRATIATYGLGAFILFITRSASQNLYHPIIPCCILLTAEALRYTRLLGRRYPFVSNLASPIALTASFGLLIAAQKGHPHPGIMDKATMEETRRIAAAPRSYRIPDRLRWFSVLPQMKQWFAEGKKVGLLGPGETPCLVAADVPPYWKYSPLCENLCFRDQVNELRLELQVRPPDVAVIPVSGSCDPIYHEVIEALRKELKQGFRLDKTANELEIYYRQ
jgi:hypothetical protein